MNHGGCRQRIATWQAAARGYSGLVKAVEVKVEGNGALTLPHGVSLPPHARLAVLVLDPSDRKTDDLSGTMIAALAEQSGAFDFLKEEPEIYSDDDILPGRENPRFRK